MADETPVRYSRVSWQAVNMADAASVFYQRRMEYIIDGWWSGPKETNEIQRTRIAEYLNQYNLSPDDQHEQYGLALCHAAKRGLAGVCEELIRRGADVNFQNRFGHTPAHSVAFVPESPWWHEDCPNIIQLLKDHGADLEIEDTLGNTAFAICARYELENPPFYVYEHFVRAGADVNTRLFGPFPKYPILLALVQLRASTVGKQRAMENIRLLCEVGHASLDVVDDVGAGYPVSARIDPAITITPESLARRLRLREVIVYFKQVRASQRDARRQTPQQLRLREMVGRAQRARVYYRPPLGSGSRLSPIVHDFISRVGMSGML